MAMKGSFITYLASARILVGALPSFHDGLSGRQAVPELDGIEARQASVLQTWAQPNYCTAATQTGAFRDIYTALIDQPSASSFDYSSFCSNVVQQYTISPYYTTQSGYQTDTVTTTTTTSISSTSTDKSHGTTTLLCATPSPSMSCNIKANGYSNNLITDSFISAADCNQLCLNTPTCKSFQVVPQYNGQIEFERCNLYNVYVAGNVDNSSAGIIATFYDRDCPNLLPSACTTSAPLITPGPSLTTTKQSISNQAIQKREYTIPTFLSTAQLIFLQPVCSCLVSEAPLPIVLTQTNLVQSWVYVTVTTVQTALWQFTVHPEFKTVYSSVS